MPTINNDSDQATIHSSEARVLESEIEELRDRLALLESAFHEEQKYSPSRTAKLQHPPIPQESHISYSSSEQAAEVARLLNEWLTDESGYDEETWPKLKDALEEDHFSARSLFDE